MNRKNLLGFFLCLVALFLLTCLVDTPASWAEKKTVSFAAGRPGDPWYALSHALSTFINERSQIIKADVVATGGVKDATSLLIHKPELRSNHVIVSMIPGFKAWTEGNFKLYKIGTITHFVSLFISLDKDVKTYSNFKGKTVTMPRKLKAGPTDILRNMFSEVGVWGQFKPMYGGFGSGLSALRDGVAQVGFQGINFIFPDRFGLSSRLEELKTRGELYFVQQGDVEKNLGLLRRAIKADPFENMELPTLAKIVPANALGTTQTKPIVALATPMLWAASSEMDEAVVQEITRIMYEAAKKGEFGQYHALGRGITPDFLVTSLWDTAEECRKNYHPGALKFYDSVGAKMKPFSE